MLDDPPGLRVTGLIDAVVLCCVRAMPVGKSRRSILRAAVLSTGDPPTGVHEVRYGPASSGDVACSLHLSCRPTTHAQSEEDFKLVRSNICHNQIQITEPMIICSSRAAHEYISWSTTSPNVERVERIETFVPSHMYL